MGKTRVLVARMDGTAGSGFARGALQPPVDDVPVLMGVDLQKRVGMATIVVEGDLVYAELDVRGLDGMFPALGVVIDGGAPKEVVDNARVVMIGLSAVGNRDAQIPAIKETR